MGTAYEWGLIGQLKKSDVAYENCTWCMYSVYMYLVRSVHVACTKRTCGMYTFKKHQLLFSHSLTYDFISIRLFC